jgi:hypothetical protein
MRVVVSIKPTPGGGQASQAARYIAYRERDEEREGNQPRMLFSAREDSLSFWRAERVLTEGRTPTKDEVTHIAVSFREEDYERLGHDEPSRQQALKEVSREAISQVSAALQADDLRWVAGIHRNTDHPHLHMLVHRSYLDRVTRQEKRLNRLPEEMLPHRAYEENGDEIIHRGSISQAFESAIDRAQERARQTAQPREQLEKSLTAIHEDERPAPRKDGLSSSDERLLEYTLRNPSIAGRELTQEIILRSPEREPEDRVETRDLRAAFKTLSLDDPDFRTQPEQADWLEKHSRELRDLYEHGAQIKDGVLVIPAEEYELPEDRDQPFISTLSYAHKQIHNPRQATEFHALARAIAGETADARMEHDVFRYYYARIRGGQSAERAVEVEKTLGEMRLLASEMSKLETRDSVEVAPSESSLGETRAAGFDEEREAEIPAGAFNMAARKVILNEESLRLPAGLSFEAKERLVTKTLPSIDRLLESGRKRDDIVAAIDEKTYDKNLSEEEREERFKSGVFLKAYIDERLKDPETHALNRSQAFRLAHAKIIEARTPEELNRAAQTILRENLQRDAALRLHQADPKRLPKPEMAPLNVRERNLIFFGRSPEHHTPEMRDLRYQWGLSRTQRAERVKVLREGDLAQSPVLKVMVEELESRRTLPAIRHYQAAILNEEMRNPGKLDLRQMFERLPPHERSFLIERTEEKKKTFLRSQTPLRDLSNALSQRLPPQNATRPFASIPRESNSYREYMSSMGAIESRLLHEAVQRREKPPGPIVSDKEDHSLSITAARNLLPPEEQAKIREQARNLAWEQLKPQEIPAQEPETRRLNETVVHLRDEAQQRARLAHQTLNEFLRQKTESGGRNEPPVVDALNKLEPVDAQRLKALEDYAARMREEFYRGFESLDELRGEIEKFRGHDEITRNQQAELTPNPPPERDQILALNGHSAGKDLPLSNDGHFEFERNLTGGEETERVSESLEQRSWFADSDQKWHFDNLPAPQVPTSIRDLNLDPGRDDIGHDHVYER